MKYSLKFEGAVKIANRCGSIASEKDFEALTDVFGAIRDLIQNTEYLSCKWEVYEMNTLLYKGTKEVV